MLTKGIWEDFEFKCKHSKNLFSGKYTYNDKKTAWLLISAIILTPFSFAIDLIVLPIEMIYILAIKKVKKMRSEE